MLESYITNIMESKVNKIQIVEKNTKKLIKSSDLFSLDFNNIILDIKESEVQLNDKFIPKKNCFDFDVNNIKFSDLTYNYEYYLEGKEIDVFFENDERKKFREDMEVINIFWGHVG